MEASRKVLIVDNTIDRKRRIAAVKERGFAVFPALRLADARSRCRPGAYDLIVVNAQSEPETAVAFCDQVQGQTPAQPVLLVVYDGLELPERDYIVANDPALLVERVEALLGRPLRSEGRNGQPDQEGAAARISA